jgi:hypothetical protein
MRTRSPVLRTAILCALVTLTTIGVALLATGRDAVPASPARSAAAARASDPAVRALAVLHAWDRRRAAAWASGDVGSLARLYVAGSRTGARDVHDLRRWRARTLRVLGLRTQVSAAEVRRSSPGRLTIVATDRTVGGVATDGRSRFGLPRSVWTTHRITLRRVRGAWLVAEVVAQPAR